MDGEARARTVALAAGVAIIVLGVVFLVTALAGGSVAGLWWPLFVIVPGLLFFAGVAFLGTSFAFLALPGSIVTSAGVLLFLQNLTGEWSTWAYAWALVSPGAVGLGLYIWGRIGDAPALVTAGPVVAKVGVGIFLVLGVFFELIIGLSDSLFMRIAWPVLLMLAGVWVLWHGVRSSVSR
jgi:hypothetical protein